MSLIQANENQDTLSHQETSESDIQSSSAAGKYAGYRLSRLGAEALVRSTAPSRAHV